MSKYSIPKSTMSTVNIVPRSLDLNGSLNKGTRLGMQTVQVNSFAPQQGTGAIAAGSSMNWNLPFSPDNLMDSVFEGSCTLTVVYNTGANRATVEAGVAEIKNKAGLNSLPINRLISSGTCKINGTVSLASNPADEVEAVLYNLSEPELKRLSDNYIPDYQASYDSATNTNVLRTADDSRGASRGLGACEVVDITLPGGANTANVQVVYRVKEALLLRPSQWADSLDPKVFQGINDLQIAMNCVPDFRIAAASQFAVVSCAMSDFKLRFKMFTPHINHPKLPPVAYYNSPMFTDMRSETAVVGAGGSRQYTINSRAFTTVPKMYAIYAEEARPAAANQPKRLLPITGVSIDSGIKKNLLSSYDAQDLYRVSKKNGYNGTSGQFYGGYNIGAQDLMTTGAVLYIVPSDLDAELYHQSNVLLNHTFGMRVTVANRSVNNSGNVTVHCVAMHDSYLSYENGRYSEAMASILPAELNGAHDMYMGTNFEGNAVMGGSVWSWLRDHAVKPAVRFARNNLAKLHTGISPLDSAAHAIGDAVKDGTTIGNYAKKHGYGSAGAGIVTLGGKKLSQQQLLKLLD